MADVLFTAELDTSKIPSQVREIQAMVAGSVSGTGGASLSGSGSGLDAALKGLKALGAAHGKELNAIEKQLKVSNEVKLDLVEQYNERALRIVSAAKQKEAGLIISSNTQTVAEKKRYLANLLRDDKEYQRAAAQAAKEQERAAALARTQGTTQLKRDTLLGRLNAEGKAEYAKFVAQNKLTEKEADRHLRAMVAANNPAYMNKKAGGGAVNMFASAAMWGGAYSLIYGFKTAVVNTLRDSEKAFLDFNTRVVQLARVTGEGMTAGFAGKIADVSHLAVKYGVEQKKVLDMTIEWATQGKTLVESLNLTEASLLAVNAAYLEEDDAVKYITSTMNAFNMSTDQATSIVDKMNAVSKKYALTANELGAALQRSSASAQAAGINLDTLMGYIATISEKTRFTGEKVGTALKTIFAHYKRPSVLNELESVGVAVKDATGQFLSFQEIITQLSAKWSQFSDIQKQGISEKMAGIRRPEEFYALLTGLNTAIDATATSLQSQGSAARDAEANMTAYEKRIASAKQAMTELVTIGSGKEAITLWEETKIIALQSVIDVAKGAKWALDQLPGSGIEPAAKPVGAKMSAQQFGMAAGAVGDTSSLAGDITRKNASISDRMASAVSEGRGSVLKTGVAFLSSGLSDKENAILDENISRRKQIQSITSEAIRQDAEEVVSKKAKIAENERLISTLNNTFASYKHLEPTSDTAIKYQNLMAVTAKSLGLTWKSNQSVQENMARITEEVTASQAKLNAETENGTARNREAQTSFTSIQAGLQTQVTVLDALIAKATQDGQSTESLTRQKQALQERIVILGQEIKKLDDEYVRVTASQVEATTEESKYEAVLDGAANAIQGYTGYVEDLNAAKAAGAQMDLIAAEMQGRLTQSLSEVSKSYLDVSTSINEATLAQGVYLMMGAAGGPAAAANEKIIAALKERQEQLRKILDANKKTKHGGSRGKEDQYKTPEQLAAEIIREEVEQTAADIKQLEATHASALEINKRKAEAWGNMLSKMEEYNVKWDDEVWAKAAKKHGLDPKKVGQMISPEDLLKIWGMDLSALFPEITKEFRDQIQTVMSDLANVLLKQEISPEEIQLKMLDFIRAFAGGVEFKKELDDLAKEREQALREFHDSLKASQKQFEEDMNDLMNPDYIRNPEQMALDDIAKKREKIQKLNEELLKLTTAGAAFNYSYSPPNITGGVRSETKIQTRAQLYSGSAQDQPMLEEDWARYAQVYDAAIASGLSAAEATKKAAAEWRDASGEIENQVMGWNNIAGKATLAAIAGTEYEQILALSNLDLEQRQAKMAELGYDDEKKKRINEIISDILQNQNAIYETQKQLQSEIIDKIREAQDAYIEMGQTFNSYITEPLSAWLQDFDMQFSEVLSSIGHSIQGAQIDQAFGSLTMLSDQFLGAGNILGSALMPPEQRAIVAGFDQGGTSAASKIVAAMQQGGTYAGLQIASAMGRTPGADTGKMQALWSQGMSQDMINMGLPGTSGDLLVAQRASLQSMALQQRLSQATIKSSTMEGTLGLGGGAALSLPAAGEGKYPKWMELKYPGLVNYLNSWKGQMAAGFATTALGGAATYYGALQAGMDKKQAAQEAALGMIPGVGAAIGMAGGPLGSAVGGAAGLAIAMALRSAMGKQDEQQSTERNKTRDLMKSGFAVANRELDLSNRYLADIKESLKPFSMPSSYYFRTRPGQGVQGQNLTVQLKYPDGQTAGIIEIVEGQLKTQLNQGLQ